VNLFRILSPFRPFAKAAVVKKPTFPGRVVLTRLGPGAVKIGPRMN
jgi:hypothetical protein